jgi:hypothetical protein
MALEPLGNSGVALSNPLGDTQQISRSWLPVSLLALLVGCQSPPGADPVLPGEPVLPAMSLYCPEGASVEQCIQYERVMEHLRRSPFTKYNLAAERLDFQDANFNNNDVGIWLLPQPSNHPDRFGGSAFDATSGTYRDLTVLYPKAFESDQELAMTLVHEAYSHQILNLLDSQEDEARAEQEASLCGIEN